MNGKTPILPNPVMQARAEAERDAHRQLFAEGAGMAIMAIPPAEIVSIFGNIGVELVDAGDVRLTIRSPGATRAYRLDLNTAFVLNLAEQIEARMEVPPEERPAASEPELEVAAP